MAKFTVICCILAAQVLSGATLYVVPPGTAGNTPTPPYNSPATAANDRATAVGRLQTATRYSSERGRTVLPALTN